MSHPSPKATAILLAGGSGSRMGKTVADKVLLAINGKAVFRYSIEAFASISAVRNIVVVYRDDVQRHQLAAHTAEIDGVDLLWARGGDERQHSVWSGLQATPQDTDIVLIHDCARPLISSQAIQDAIAAAQANGAACVARKTTDTIKTVVADSTHPDAYLPTTIDRSALWSMETPQTFRFTLIRDAYQQVIDEKKAITDDLSAIEGQQMPVVFIENGQPNPKLTTTEDIAFIEFLSSRQQK